MSRRRALLSSVALVSLAGCTSANVGAPRPGAAPAVAIADAETRHTLILLGDGGEAAAGDPLLRAVRVLADSSPRATTVVFLGDNVYSVGLPKSTDPTYEIKRRVLDAQIQAAGDATALFVPGNHDWGEGHTDPRRAWDVGLRALTRQAEYVRSASGGRARLVPFPACAGPHVEDAPPFRILALDTQWWLAAVDATPPRLPPADTAGCAARDRGSVAAVLRTSLLDSSDAHAIVVGHHPLASSGRHGRTGWLIRACGATLGQFTRACRASAQDLRHPTNRTFRDSLNAALRSAPPLLYAAGHDHDIELFRGPGARFTVVSGTASGRRKLDGFTGRDASSLYGVKAPGFVRLDAFADGRVALRIVVVGNGGAARTVSCRWIAPDSLSDRLCER